MAALPGVTEIIWSGKGQGPHKIEKVRGCWDLWCLFDENGQFIVSDNLNIVECFWMVV